MIEGGTDAWVARVAVVEPVVVVGHPVVGGLALHAGKTALAAVDEVVVRDSDVFRTFLDVHCTVALGLVGVAARFAVEEVHVVNPNIGVVGIQRQNIVHTEHDGEVAELRVLASVDEDAEAPDGGIVADALDGDGHFAVGSLTLYLQSLCRGIEAVHIVGLDGADDADGKRRGVVALLVECDDVLKSFTSGDGATAAGDDVVGNGLGFVGPDVEDLCALLQRAIIFVGSDAARHADVGKSRAVVGLDLDGGCDGCVGSHFAAVVDGHHLELIAAGL